MDELEALRKLVEEHDYIHALELISEMDEMAKDDKISKVKSFLVVLLVHLIKQNAEKRSTSSWERSINHSLFGIINTNKRKSAGGYYLKQEELIESINYTFKFALKEAATEAFGGAFSTKILSEMIDSEAIKQEALNMIINYED